MSSSLSLVASSETSTRLACEQSAKSVRIQCERVRSPVVIFECCDEVAFEGQSRVQSMVRASCESCRGRCEQGFEFEGPLREVVRDCGANEGVEAVRATGDEGCASRVEGCA